MTELANHRGRIWLVAAVVIGIGLAVSVAGWLLWNAQIDNNPARIYSRYSSQLDEYAARLQDGKVAQGADGEYALPQFLIDCGARHARREGDCFVISFSFMPTDPVPELWFAPSGFDPLPSGLTDRKSRAYFKFVPLGGKWAECDWDT